MCHLLLKQELFVQNDTKLQTSQGKSAVPFRAKVGAIMEQKLRSNEKFDHYCVKYKIGFLQLFLFEIILEYPSVIVPKKIKC